MTLRCLSSFAGVGSLLLGDWLGWSHVAAIEKDPYCRAVLERRYPGLPIHIYAGKAPYAQYRGLVDIVTAGWPCQPLSLAGKQLGFNDPRDGWRHVVRALRVVRPGLLFGESVAAVLSHNGGRYFGRVLCDLSALGYDAEWLVLGADQAGAPHRRERCYILAHARRDRRSERSESDGGTQQSGQPTSQRHDADGRGPAMAAAEGGRRRRARQHERNAAGYVAPIAAGSCPRRDAEEGSAGVADADGSGSEVSGAIRRGRPDAVQCRGRAGNRRAQPALGRVPDGLADRMDWPARRGDWPAPPGEAAREWEAPRTCETHPGRTEAIRALGNGWVTAQAVLAWHILSARAGIAA